MARPQRGYPLGALFVLVTVCGVLIAGVTPLVQRAWHGESDLVPLLVAMLVGIMAGGIIGMVIGLLHFRRLVTTLLGMLAGTIIGCAAGLIALLPENRMLTAAFAIAAGSGLAVGVALLMRKTS